MSGIFLWAGLVIILAFPNIFPNFPSISLVGSILMVIGLVLLIVGR